MYTEYGIAWLDEACPGLGRKCPNLLTEQGSVDVDNICEACIAKYRRY